MVRRIPVVRTPQRPPVYAPRLPPAAYHAQITTVAEKVKAELKGADPSLLGKLAIVEDMARLPTMEGDFTGSEQFPILRAGKGELADVAKLLNRVMHQAGMRGGGAGRRTILRIIDEISDYPSILAVGSAPIRTNDWTSLLRAAGQQGQIFRLLRDTVADVTDTVPFVAGSGFVGPRSAVINVPAETEFSSLDITALFGNKLFHATGGATLNDYIDGITFRGFTVRFATVDTRVLTAISVRNAHNVEISDLNIWGGSVMNGVRLNTVKGGSVTGCYIHDAVLDGLAAFTRDGGLIGDGRPQASAIEVDGSRLDAGEAFNSTDLIISGNRISRLNFTGDALANAGGFEQTDAINIQSIGEARDVVADNAIDHVGEAIDLFGDFCTVTGNTMSDIGIAGLKLPHAASHNTLMGNTMRRIGLIGIGLGGGVLGPVENNRVIGNIVEDI